MYSHKELVAPQAFYGKIVVVLWLATPPHTPTTSFSCFSTIYNIFIDHFFNFWLHSTTHGTLVPQLGIDSMPPALEGRVLTTGPPGKSWLTTYLSGFFDTYSHRSRLNHYSKKVFPYLRHNLLTSQL